jgi:hypothetical protein
MDANIFPGAEFLPGTKDAPSFLASAKYFGCAKFLESA